MRTPDLDLDLARCFVSVVESGGFTLASKHLHLTQAAVSLKIQRLEELLSRRLFIRTTKPLELTLDGEVVLGYARRLLNLNQEMLQRLSAPSTVDVLRLGIVHHFGYQFLPVWLSEFKETWPNLRLITDAGLNAELLKGLGEDRFDLVIASAGYVATSEHKMAPLVRERYLQTEPLVWVQAEKSQINPRKEPLPLVMFGPHCQFRPVCLEALQKAARAWEIVFDGGSLSTVQSAVKADLGLTILGLSSIISGIKIVGEPEGLPPLPKINLAMYSRESSSEPLVERLASFLVDAVDRWQKSFRSVLNGPALNGGVTPSPK
jgi:DNA-binding transcriptional LysR family regulator